MEEEEVHMYMQKAHTLVKMCSLASTSDYSLVKCSFV